MREVLVRLPLFCGTPRDKAALAFHLYGRQRWRWLDHGVRIARRTVPYRRIEPGLRTRPSMAFVGDSAIYGVGASSPESSMAGLLGARAPGFNVFNIARPGATIETTFQRLRAFRRPVNILVVCVGTNDAFRGTPYDSVRRSFQRLMEVACERAEIVLTMHGGDLGLAPFFRVQQNGQWRPTYMSRLMRSRMFPVRRLHQEAGEADGVSFVDFIPFCRTPEFLADVGRWFAPDGCHPSDDCHDVGAFYLNKALLHQGIDLRRFS